MLLMLDVEFKCSKWKNSNVRDIRVKWWNLTKENARKLSERITKEGIWTQVEDADTTWKAMAECMRRSSRKMLGTLRRVGSKMDGA